MVKTTLDYKATMQELQQLIENMQSGELDVDAALEKYQRGQVLITKLKKHLEVAENTIIQHKLPRDQNQT